MVGYCLTGLSEMFHYRWTVTKISSDSFDQLRELEFDATALFLPLEDLAIDLSLTAWILKWVDMVHLAEDSLFSSPVGRDFCHNSLHFFSLVVLSSHNAALEICLDHEERDCDGPETFVGNARAHDFWDHCMVCSLVAHT